MNEEKKEKIIAWMLARPINRIQAILGIISWFAMGILIGFGIGLIF
jgi:hypothetical protein